MPDGTESSAPLADHWLDRVIASVVEHNTDLLSAHQIVNAIMHSPPIVNAIQEAIDERGPAAAEDPTFAQAIRKAFLSAVAANSPKGGEFLDDESSFLGAP